MCNESGSKLELLEIWRQRVVLVCFARLAPAPFPFVLADAPPSALLARALYAVLADALPSAIPALVPLPIVLADAPPSALLAPAPSPSVLADARPSAILAPAPSSIVLADARPSALLARAPLPIVLALPRLPPSCSLPPPAAPNLVSVWRRPLTPALSTLLLRSAPPA